MNKNELKKKVTVMAGGCWQVGTQTNYPTIYMDGEYKLARRVFYEAFVGPIDDAHIIVQKCRKKWCVAPNHSRQMSGPEATRAGIKARSEQSLGVVARWMDHRGLTRGDIAAVTGVSKSVAGGWRQNGYPPADKEALLRAKYKDFPAKPMAEGTI